MSLKTWEGNCPYCGESIDLEFEDIEGVQTFIEDCSVCCRPIQYDISPGSDGPEVLSSRSD